MDWSDEQWVKLYRRDTADWLLLSWRARGLFYSLLRIVTRAGVLDLGKTGKRAVAVLLGAGGEWKEIVDALEELVADGCVQINGTTLVIPNFVEAQDAVKSDKARAKAARERRRDAAIAAGNAGESVTNRDADNTNRDASVTGSDSTVTADEAASRSVTPRHAASRREEREMEREMENLSPAPPAPPTPPLALTSPADEEKPAKAKRPKADKPPPPFSVAEALGAIASTAGRRFVPGDVTTWTGGWKIAIAQHVRRFPDLPTWSLVGEWLAQGGASWAPTHGAQWAASNHLVDAVAKAQAWAASGRGVVDARAAVAPSPVAPPTASQPHAPKKVYFGDEFAAAARAAREDA